MGNASVTRAHAAPRNKNPIIVRLETADKTGALNLADQVRFHPTMLKKH